MLPVGILEFSTFKVYMDLFVFRFLHFLFLTIINTPKFKTPPIFVNLVVRCNTITGTSVNSSQTPYTPQKHHWMKKAATNSDMFLAALRAADLLGGFGPSCSWSNLISEFIFNHDKVYKIVFMMTIVAKGTVKKNINVVFPFTPSVRHLKYKNIYIYIYNFAASSEKAFSNVRRMRRLRSFWACVKYHPSLCSIFLHSLVNNGSVSEQRRPWSDCANAQADLGLCCPHMPDDMLSNGAAEFMYHDYPITKSRLFKYTENFTTNKKWKFSNKNSVIFHISAQNIDCGHPSKPPHRGGFNEYLRSMLWAQIRKIMYTPINPSFTT